MSLRVYTHIISARLVFRKEGGMEAAQAMHQKWIEEEHRKINDSVTGNLISDLSFSAVLLKLMLQFSCYFSDFEVYVQCRYLDCRASDGRDQGIGMT
jgi:hypothetical protein